MTIKQKIEELIADLKANYGCTAYYNITGDSDFNNQTLRHLWYGDYCAKGELCLANIDYKYRESDDLNSFFDELVVLKTQFETEYDSLNNKHITP